ncbi:MAG: hypothetical protein QME13_07405 [Thermoanaerobacteraceae bacterium]|nr:hypothetical protein [Thermoanaerobacteraceae bacterium]
MEKDAMDTVISLMDVFTLALAAATVWLAFATHKLAGITKQMFELEARPYFALSNFLFRFYIKKQLLEGDTPAEGDLKFGLEFRNPGKVAVTYKVQRIGVTFNGKTIENPTFSTMGGTITPGNFGVFWYGVIPKVDFSSLPRGGIVEYEIEYFSIPDAKRYTTKQKIEYVLNSVEPYSLDWRYLHEEDNVSI